MVPISVTFTVAILSYVRVFSKYSKTIWCNLYIQKNLETHFQTYQIWLEMFCKDKKSNILVLLPLRVFDHGNLDMFDVRNNPTTILFRDPRT